MVFLNVILKDLVENFYLFFPLQCLSTWIRIHMDIFGILDPDPHKNLCGSETLLQSYWCLLINEYILILLDKFEKFLISFIPNIPVGGKVYVYFNERFHSGAGKGLFRQQGGA